MLEGISLFDLDKVSLSGDLLLLPEYLLSPRPLPETRSNLLFLSLLLASILLLSADFRDVDTDFTSFFSSFLLEEVEYFFFDLSLEDDDDDDDEEERDEDDLSESLRLRLVFLGFLSESFSLSADTDLRCCCVESFNGSSSTFSSV